MRKVLIANRGEIAVRIARACRDYGVASVAVYADQDHDALFVRLADEALGLGGTRAADTYLDAGKLIEAARRAGADALHPGYGFLSENADFARAVQAAGLIWIGPDPQVIAALGDKVAARALARRVGAPLAPGSDGPLAGPAEAAAFAAAHGLPIAIKAAHGGGGRGIKVARRLDEVEELYAAAVREATAAFGRGACYVERFLERPRHIEAQILADGRGAVVVLGTRDCSLQRRNQKLVEEAPAPFLAPATRARVHDAARAICAAAGYRGAGTVEFLLGADGALTFLEVNARLQVEHPVTEETSGVDLVVEQLRIADGQALRFEEAQAPRGHSIEFRVNAEDPGRGFLPTPGAVTLFEPPGGPGVRVEAGVASGSHVSGAFDSLIAKLVITGADRAQALARARRALREFRVEGVATTLPFHRAVVEAPDFVGADGFAVHTGWIDANFMGEAAARPHVAAAPALLRVAVEIDGRRVALGLPSTLLTGLSAGAAQTQAPAAAPPAPAQDGVAAPVAGIVRALKVESGAKVEAGALLATMEAMKMESPIVAPKAGVVRPLVAEGDAVQAGDLLFAYS
jgi:acetyl-CoA/propionyl-CoA carboxylase biotin carboxyl carrier protein